MRTVEILKFMSECGARWSPEIILDANVYFSKMIVDNRVVSISKDGKLIAIVAFSICDEFKPFYDKYTFDFIPHDAKGSTVYLEKLIAKDWNKQIRTQFETIITEMYPNIQYGVWHRHKNGLDIPIKVNVRRKQLCTK